MARQRESTRRRPGRFLSFVGLEIRVDYKCVSQPGLDPAIRAGRWNPETLTIALEIADKAL